ncbi:hypothetical protein FA95DRAFT_1570133, partial [Auriscalpium vulgare]
MQFFLPPAYNHPPRPRTFFALSAPAPPRLPLSAERAAAPPTSPSPRPARYDPLGVLHPAPAPAGPSQFQLASVPYEVTRGVMSNGRWNPRHPAVQDFLRSPRPPSPACMPLFVLAALHVMYSPGHPAYDFFWSEDDRRSTADHIDRLLGRDSCPIATYPASWLGAQEMLWQLAGLQKDYARHHGAALQPAVRRMFLRKRKPAPAVREESVAASEASEPPRKRVRRSKLAEDAGDVAAPSQL